MALLARDPFAVLVLVAALAVAGLVIFLARGERQRAEGGGTRGRLLAVAAGVTGLALVPPLAWLALVVAGRPVPEEAAIVATIFGFATAGSLLHAPVPRLSHARTLPLADDPALLARVAEIAARLGVAPPRIRVLGSTSSALSALAWAGGLPAHSLVVTDGVLHRLSPAERDAVIAHEIAHVSTGSLWTLSAIGPTAGTAAIGAAAALGSFPDAVEALIACLAAFLFLRTLVGRAIEVACDRAGARAVGFATMAAALDKIHAAHRIPGESRAARAFYALATHPPRAIRLARLREAAPESERAAIEVDAALAGQHEVARAAALAAWVVTLAVAFDLGSRPDAGWRWLGAGVLLAMLLAPVALARIAMRETLRRIRRRLAGAPVPGQRLAWVALAVGVLGFFL
ncbi:MAG TPA: M48 family metalloprotease, partial [Planctomycetota bacterium]|nr:M48 family metalloprotease [Planctomycetota bacterium]